MVNFKIDTCPNRVQSVTAGRSLSSASGRVGNEVDLYDFTSHRFESFGHGRRRDWYRERIIHSKPDHFESTSGWMQKETFYDIDFGIHSMKIPKTGEYQFILSGYGIQQSKGCRITMIKRMYQEYYYFRFNFRLLKVELPVYNY